MTIARRFWFAAVLASVCAFGGVARAADDADAARDRFERGVERYRERDFQAALDHFDASYRLAPLPEVLHNLALAHRELGHDVEALECFERYQREMSGQPTRLTPQRREFVEKQIAELKTRVGEVAFDITPREARTVLDGKTVVTSPRVYVAPGPHRLDVSAPGFRSADQPFQAEAGPRPLTIRIALEPLPALVRDQPPPPAPPFLSTTRGVLTLTTGAIAVAALVGGGVLGVVALDMRSDYEASCVAPSTCDPGLYGDGKKLATAADVLLVVGAVSLVTATVLLLTRPTSPAR